MILENKISYDSVICKMLYVHCLSPLVYVGRGGFPFYWLCRYMRVWLFCGFGPCGGGGRGNRGAGLNKDIDFDHSSLKE